MPLAHGQSLLSTVEGELVGSVDSAMAIAVPVSGLPEMRQRTLLSPSVIQLSASQAKPITISKAGGCYPSMVCR